MRRFKEVYYIIQTSPVLAKSTYTFSEKEAKKLCRIIQYVSGGTCKIVKFTRDELIQLKS